MDKKDEALKLALEALEWINRVNAMDYEYQQKARESLNAIYEALAEQPAQQQEPVAWGGDCVLGHCGWPSGCEASNRCRADNPPAQPSQSRSDVKPWAGLTDDEIDALAEHHGLDCMVYEPFARAIEAKLREKNT